jgi:DNA-binding response OmpR family regulator
LEESPKRVMVVDDDPDTCALIVDVLVNEGYQVFPYLSGEPALDVLKQEQFDLILSDIRMPRVSGIDLLHHVRRLGLDTAVILMTAYASLETAIEALRGEAFDYVTKPFSLSDLRQRVHQALEAPPSRQEQRFVRYQDLTIDLHARRVWIDEREIKLTRLEFDVLAYLASRQGRAVSREELLRHVWGHHEPLPSDSAKVKVCVRRSRLKLGDDGRDPRYIFNVWGVGYQFGE